MRFSKAILAGAAVILAACPAPSLAQTLAPGSKAPPLSIKRWIKGAPLAELPQGVVVVEFWATWCPPCVESIPHLTKLAKAHPNVTFLGVSIWEEDKDGVIDGFVQKMGAKMDYLVAYGGNQDGMAKTWMEAAGQNGIPAAFILKDQVIQWIGHPMEMDQPLKRVISGSLKPSPAKPNPPAPPSPLFNEKLQKEYQSILEAYSAGKTQEAWTRLAELEVRRPVMRFLTESARLGWVAQENEAAFLRLVDAALKDESGMGINNVGSALFSLVTKPKAKDAALKAADRLMDAQGPMRFFGLFYAAMAYDTWKQPEKARAAAEKARELAKSPAFPGLEELMKSLDWILKRNSEKD